MSQIHARDQVLKLTSYIVTLAVMSVVVVALAAAPSYAQVAPEEPIEPTPALVVPVPCTAPADSSAPGIHFVSTTPTNSPSLQWSWSFIPPETPEGDEPFAIDSYAYVVYNGSTLQTEGTLDATATAFSYDAPSDGTYSLYIWTIQGDEEPAYCGEASITLDATPPLIVNDGYSLDGAVATPLLSTEETDLTYTWTVNRQNTGVEIDDPAALTPTFTFLRDGTYNFVLTATDSFGNSTTMLLSITYVAPFVVPPTGPEIIPEETIPLPVETYTPLEEAAPVAFRSAPVPSGDGRLPPEIDASIYSTTVDGKEERSGTEKEVAGTAIAAGRDGWKVLGLSWYWWILIAAIIGTAWLWFKRNVIGRVAAPDDV